MLLCRVVGNAVATHSHPSLKGFKMLLCQQENADGRPLKVVELQMPKPVVFQGDRLPASYANFYIGNRVVLMPSFNDPADEPNRARLAALFPGREVIGIDCTDLVLGLGTFHCLTQQVPLV